jgi:hypothetical protein
MKPVIVKFEREAYEEYKKLQNSIDKSKNKPTNKQLLFSIDNAINNIKLNPYYGNLIPKKYLTSKVIDKYGTNKILRVELVGYWRLLYTLIGDEARIIAFVLEYMSHKNYDTLFGYKKK